MPNPRQHGIDFTVHTTNRAQLGESPVWCATQDCIWWVDIEGRLLLRTRVADGHTDTWPTPETPGFVVLTQNSTPAIGMETGIFQFCAKEETFQRIVNLDVVGMRFNDATVDNTGRLWAGTMATGTPSPVGVLYSVGPEMVLKPMLNGLSTPNGLAVDDTRGRLYLSDSHPSVQTIWTFPYDHLTGELGPRDIFVNMENMVGRPDGAALDQNGNYWIAAVDGGVLYTFSPDSTLLETYEMPFRSPTKLAFGGHSGECIFVTSKGGETPNGALALGRIQNGEGICGQAQNAWDVAI